LIIAIFIIFLIFISIYFIQLKQQNLNYQKEKIFYEIMFYSQNFLYEIYKEYENKKQEILKAHKYALNHLNEDFEKIKQKLGKNYHLFLTDQNFIIRKTTFKYDQNFSLQFIKNILITHKTPHISPPICEMATTKFISFTDSYQNKKVFQIGYVFNTKKINYFKNKLKEIKKSPIIKDIAIYFVYPKIPYASKCQILTPLYRKYTLNEMNIYKEAGLKLYKKLLKKNPIEIDNKFYFLSFNPLKKDGFIIFEITLSPFIKNEIQKFTYILIIIALLFFLVIFFIFKYINNIISSIEKFADHIKNEKTFTPTNNKELNLIIKSYNNTLEKLKSINTQKEEFLQFAMHEISTPLSILALTELDDIQKSALNRLILSKNKMENFLHIKKEKFELINLKQLIKKRVKFFEPILKIENKKINLFLNHLCVKANIDDMISLIDNNISNAIKYSQNNTIEIILKNKKLIFKNKGIIQNKEKIFEKFYTNGNKGGFGIGLNIIKNIITKYNIYLNLYTKNNEVIFEYNLKEIYENCSN
jgi:signal transduction histidine kinase